MSETFRVVGPDGKKVKVNPKKGKYQPKPEETKKRKHYYEGGDVNGVSFPAGFYIWPFWGAPVVDDDKPVQPDNGPDISQAPASDSSSSYEPTSSYPDSSSSSSSYSDSSFSDSGSSGGDGGGGGD